MAKTLGTLNFSLIGPFLAKFSQLFHFSPFFRFFIIMRTPTYRLLTHSFTYAMLGLLDFPGVSFCCKGQNMPIIDEMDERVLFVYRISHDSHKHTEEKSITFE